jgi:hypothetical protein
MKILEQPTLNQQPGGRWFKSNPAANRNQWVRLKNRTFLLRELPHSIAVPRAVNASVLFCDRR